MLAEFGAVRTSGGSPMHHFRAWLCVVGLCFPLLAHPALFVSGDSNIANGIGSTTANQNFFTNIVEGTSVVVQDSTRQFLASQATELVDFYNGSGFSATLLGTASEVSAAALAGADLFIAFAPDDGFTVGEVAALNAFLAAGGNVMITGENSNFLDLNDIVNDLLAALGSTMRIVDDIIDAGFHTAILQGPSPYLAGTVGFQYAATSRVTGGLGLYGTESGNQTFLAVESLAIPEPATWWLVGLAVIGLAFRHGPRRTERRCVA